MHERRLVGVSGRREHTQQSSDQRTRKNRTRVEVGAATEGPSAEAANGRIRCAYMRTKVCSRRHSQCKGWSGDPLRRICNALAVGTERRGGSDTKKNCGQTPCC